MSVPKRRYTLQQVILKLHVSTRTIYKWLKSGKVKSFKEGRHRIFDADQIDGLYLELTEIRELDPGERVYK